MALKDQCPYCKSSQTIRRGLRKNKSGIKQMFWCNHCERRFTYHDAFWKKKHTPEIIVEACSSYKRGMSLRDVKDHLSEYRATDITRTTVLNWVNEYGKLLKKFANKQHPQIKGPLHTDDLHLNLKKTKFTNG